MFGHLAEPVHFLDAVASCQAVVHTAVGQWGQVTETDHRAVASMLEVLADRSATFVLTSGLGVYAGSTADLIDEDTPLDSVMPPQQPRAALERTVLGAAASVRPVIVRPAHVYGHGRAGAFTQLLLRASCEADAGVYIEPGTGMVRRGPLRRPGRGVRRSAGLRAQWCLQRGEPAHHDA